MPLRSGSLVCDACWGTLFTFDAFQTALSAKDSDSGPSRGFSYTTQPWDQIEEGEEKGCNWCDFLWDEIRFWYKSKKKKESPEPEEKFNVIARFENHKEHQRVILRLIIENDWSPSYSVCCHPEDNAAEFIPGRNLVWQVSSPRAYELASKCLTECTLHHTCPKPSKKQLPTRVIDCTDPENPKLIITAGLEGTYAALSYVWGEPQPHRTTTRNIPAYLGGIPYNILPQTIRDAITCTARLGLHYLWIDSLCILQDSIEDKDREIPQMCNIYHDAYFTIIAAAASRVGQGFLRDRAEPIDSILPFWCPDGRMGTISVEEEGRTPEGGVEPVDSRAWCYQERLLSPRALIYTTDTLRYRCQAVQNNVGDASFYFPPGKNDGLKLPTIMLSDTPTAAPLADEDLKALRDAWWEIVAEYTKRRLTESSDKLLAISGVAQLFQRYWKTRYIAGLWEINLSGDLLWKHKRARRSAGEVLIPGDYRAPSWSWAAADGAINSGSKLTSENILWTIHKCEAVPATQNEAFGRIVGGVLEVHAILRPVVWDPAEMELYEVPQAPKAKTARPRKGHVGYAYLDDEDDSVNQVAGGKIRGFAVVVGTDSKERPIRRLMGLLVVPEVRLGTDGAFRRVGMFYANGQHNEDADYDEDAPSCDVDAWIGAPREVACIL
ncbi:heterokaryon incompatibility protein-domain-containing protein [Collybia nuda]|uniref:Heterokaryon incompatibility protein-domain-containing protein n=1 Tax=Collybia nuda TaxID=64659 RepID=A0A9P5YBC3_9AGAR|nr:heterokaryon incompatibility protein-domain-containing protein [Collybia nuda]